MSKDILLKICNSFNGYYLRSTSNQAGTYTTGLPRCSRLTKVGQSVAYTNPVDVC